MSADYFAPAFSVSINRAALQADVSKNIMNVSVTHEPDTMDSFRLTIANPYPDMPWTHDDRKAKLFQEGSEVRIEMGYVGDLREVFDGLITGVSPTFPNSGVPTLSVNGYTQMQRLQGTPRVRTFQQKTDKEIAQQIAGDLQLELEADETKTRHPYVIQYNQTDLAFLLERAGRINFKLQVQDGKLIFRRTQGSQDKTYLLVWGRPRQQIDPTQNIMPLKEFNPTLNTLRPANRVIVRGQHPTSRERFEGRGGQGDEESDMGGSQTGPQTTAQALGAERELTIVNIPISSQDEADQIARSIYNELSMKFLTGSGSTIGLPDLRAGRFVELAGLGTRFSGRYYVTQTTHTLSDSGYETRFTVERNSA